MAIFLLLLTYCNIGPIVDDFVDNSKIKGPEGPKQLRFLVGENF
jgi:hypothetical protein